MIVEFVHPNLGEEVNARAGYYCPLEEHILPYRDRELLYVLGHACIDNSCCGGNSDWGYIQVPGLLVRKHVRHESQQAISEVEIVEDEATRREIKDLVQSRHPGAQIELWGTSYQQSGEASS